MMPGKLVDDTVLVSEQKEGSQLYNKGNYGYPISGGGVELDLIEATYLVECGRLDVEHQDRMMTFQSLFRHASALEEDFDIRYIVYRDMRSRGFVVKSEQGDFDLSIYPRGMMISNSRPIYLVKSVSERTAFDIDVFMRQAENPLMSKKELLYAVVDEEGDLTYYAISKASPRGKIEEREETQGPAEGVLVRDRVFVFNADEAERIFNNGFFGKMMDKVLQLSLIESCYLMSKGRLNVSEVSNPEIMMSYDELLNFGEKAQGEFSLRLKAFSDLRSKGMLVKTGFKYGTHFRVYEESPDDSHAKYLVHAVESKQLTMWPEISRAVRLAHGVKKEILFSLVSDDGLDYLGFKRTRP
jgi:tRNA-intron endonuclease